MLPLLSLLHSILSLNIVNIETFYYLGDEIDINWIWGRVKTAYNTCYLSETVIGLFTNFCSGYKLYDTENPVIDNKYYYVIFRHLLVNPRDRRVVVCESILCPTQFRQTLAKVFFKRYEVCLFLILYSWLLTSIL